MPEKMSIFEGLLLIVGVTAAILGFHLINQVYIVEGVINWLTVIAIFTWLILLVTLVALSLGVYVAKKQLIEMENLVNLLSQNKGKK